MRKFAVASRTRLFRHFSSIPSITDKEESILRNQRKKEQRHRDFFLCPACGTHVSTGKYVNHLQHCAYDLLLPLPHVSSADVQAVSEQANKTEKKLRECIIKLRFIDKLSVNKTADLLKVSQKRVERAVRMASKDIPLVIDSPGDRASTIIRVLFEDRDILVIDKQPRINHHPRHRWEGGTLLNSVMGYVQSNGGDPTAVGPCTRLDRDTSGVCVFAKHKAAASVTGQILSGEGSAYKEYLALTEAPLPLHQVELTHHRCSQHVPVAVAVGEEFVVDRPLALGPKRVKAQPLMRVTALFDGGKASTTRFQLLDRSEKGHELLLCTLETGRTHQIRVHLQSIQRPVLGDATYGTSPRVDMGTIGRQALHAWRLRFRHPRSNEDLEFVAPPPADFNVACKLVGVNLP